MSEQKMQCVANLANSGLITFTNGIWVFTEKGRDKFADYIKPEMTALEFIDWFLLNLSWILIPAH